MYGLQRHCPTMKILFAILDGELIQLIISGDKTLKLNGITKMINAKIKSIDRYIESVQVRIPNTNMRERKYRLTTYIERCICNKYDKLTPDEQEAHEEYENNERPTF
eukprot:155794_1